MTDKKSNITIYNQRLAGYLMYSGFPLIGMAQNKYDNSTYHKKNVFFFVNSEELQNKIRDWKLMKNFS